MIRLYDQASAGNVVYSEQQTVNVVRGIFNVTIGSVTPIPAALGFDRPYFLSLSVDDGPEMIPRTAVTASPYALHSWIADSIAGGLVRSVNGQSGALTVNGLGTVRVMQNGGTITIRDSGVSTINGMYGDITFVGAGATNVSRSGNTVTITSRDSVGSGVTGVLNLDESITITRPNGQVPLIGVAPLGITTDKLNNEAVTTDKLADISITTRKIADQAITTPKIADAAVTNVKLGPSSVTSDKIMDATIATADLADNSVTSSKIADATIVNADLADNSVTSSKIVDGTIATQDLGDASVTSAKIADATIVNADLADNSVTTSKIADGQVQTPDIAAQAVTLDKINTTGATIGQTPTFDGTNLIFSNPTSSALVLPFAQTGTTAATMFALTNLGTGGLGSFTINNPASTANALLGTSDGAGSGVLGLHSSATGTAAGVRGESNSTDANAVGVSGVINSTTPGGFSAGVRGFNNSTGGLGIGVYGSQAGSGWGVYGTTPSGIGVYGNSSNGFGLYANSTNGTGLQATSSNGMAADIEITNSANTSDALRAGTNGAGNAIIGVQNGSGATTAGVRGESNSTGSNAVGVVGVITNTSPGGFSAGVRGINNGTGGLGIGVYGSQGGSGWGVYGNAPGGIGVYGNSTTGFGLYANSTDGTGLQATSINGTAASLSLTNAANSSNVAAVSTVGTGSGITVQLTNASNGARGIDVTQSGVGPGVFATSAGGNAVWGVTSSISAAGVIGDNTFGEAVVGRNRGGNGVGAVVGRNDSSGYGVRGFNTKDGIGVLGQAGISGGTGTAGRFENVNAANTTTALQVANNGIGSGISVQLTNASNGARGIDVTQSGVGPGVFATSAGGNAVWGITSSISAAGVIGDNTFGEAVVGRNRGGNGVGAVVGRNDSSGYGVRGFNTKDGIGVLGQAGISGGTGVAGRFENVNAANTSDALQVVTNSSGNAARFTGNVVINGNLTVSGTVAKGGGSFMIDHPLDPKNKILYHSFVESPDMKNIYDGVVSLDASGEAVVTLPNWFEALNGDFRYQLTSIGAPGPELYIAEEIKDNRFKIAGGKPGMKVSWLVTGIRHDPYAEKHRIQVEVDKAPADRGTYLQPDVYGVDGGKNGVSVPNNGQSAKTLDAGSGQLPSNGAASGIQREATSLKTAPAATTASSSPATSARAATTPARQH
jgi:hypothetical protein